MVLMLLVRGRRGEDGVVVAILWPERLTLEADPGLAERLGVFGSLGGRMATNAGTSCAPMGATLRQGAQ